MQMNGLWLFVEGPLEIVMPQLNSLTGSTIVGTSSDICRIEKRCVGESKKENHRGS